MSRKSSPAQTLLLAALCMLITACSERTDVPVGAATPEKAVRAFYGLRTRTPSTGLPSEAQLAELRPYVSDELYGLLAGIAAHMKDKPPRSERSFVDGDVFSSLFDGPTSFTTGDIEKGPGDEHLIAVQLISAQQLPAMRWVDHVRVVREHDRYVVADIQYANHWSVGSKQTLVETLRKEAKIN